MITPDMLAKSGTEHGEQAALFCWAGMPNQKNHYPDLRWLHAIPNAGARGNKVAASQLKAEGAKAGVADVFLPVVRQRNPLGYYCGLYIELKRANGVPSDVTEEQLQFGKHVTQQGYAWHVAFGYIEATQMLVQYLSCETITLTAKQARVQFLLNAILR